MNFIFLGVFGVFAGGDSLWYLLNLSRNNVFGKLPRRASWSLSTIIGYSNANQIVTTFIFLLILNGPQNLGSASAFYFHVRWLYFLLAVRNIHYCLRSAVYVREARGAAQAG